jgi:hypothetical protein
VQLYTTPSLVRWLSTVAPGAHGQPGLLAIITGAVLQAMVSQSLTHPLPHFPRHGMDQPPHQSFWSVLL